MLVVSLEEVTLLLLHHSLVSCSGLQFGLLQQECSDLQQQPRGRDAALGLVETELLESVEAVTAAGGGDEAGSREVG